MQEAIFPNIRLITGKTRAVNARLLACTDADGHTVFRLSGLPARRQPWTRSPG